MVAYHELSAERNPFVMIGSIWVSLLCFLNSKGIVHLSSIVSFFVLILTIHYPNPPRQDSVCRGRWPFSKFQVEKNKGFHA